MVKPIPDGFHNATVCLTVNDSVAAIDFYKKVFDAQELFRMPGPDGKKTMHAEIKIGDSIIMLNDEFPQMNCKSPQSIGGSGSGVYLYVPNADAAIKKAGEAGAKITMPVADMFWGDRMGSLVDPFGHNWTVATHIKDLTPEEMAKAGQEAMKNMCK
jgi:uncharacterized glyoxalase superfamily protein PhnB